MAQAAAALLTLRRRRPFDAPQLAAQGFEYSVAFCTSYRSKALFAKEGFEYWGGERYRTFTFNGRTWCARGGASRRSVPRRVHIL